MWPRATTKFGTITRGATMLHLKREGLASPKFWDRPLYLRPYGLTLNHQIRYGNTCDRRKIWRMCFCGSSEPHLRGRASNVPQIFESPKFMLVVIMYWGGCDYNRGHVPLLPVPVSPFSINCNCYLFFIAYCTGTFFVMLINPQFSSVQ